MKLTVELSGKEKLKEKNNLIVAQGQPEKMVGERRFELPTSTSRTWRANQAALLPDFMLYCKTQCPERGALTRLRYSPLTTPFIISGKVFQGKQQNIFKIQSSKIKFSIEKR